MLTRLAKPRKATATSAMVWRRSAFCNSYRPPILVAAQRIGVQRPATALTGPDHTSKVCRQRATKINWTEPLMGHFNTLLGGARLAGYS
jgi:hypothetical protein